MRPLARHDRVDALRALALLPVLVVNLGSFRTPSGDLMLAPVPESSPSAWLLSWVITALLMGKGITLLNFLVGYGLTLGRAPQRRARRLLALGLLHGILLYFGDILSSYAVAMLMALRHRHARLRSLFCRGIFWTLVGLTLVALLTFAFSADSGGDDIGQEVARAVGFAAWWQANASFFAVGLLAALLVMMPLTYGLTLLGMAAGRLRLFSHRRWRPLWQRLARGALPGVALNLAVALALLQGSLSGDFFVCVLMALLTLPSWVAWCLLRPRLPSFLSLAGRNTLSIYLSGSLLIVLLLSGAGLHWAPGTVALTVVAALAWLLLAAASAAASRAGRRLPFEAWMARA